MLAYDTLPTASNMMFLNPFTEKRRCTETKAKSVLLKFAETGKSASPTHMQHVHIQPKMDHETYL